MAPPEVAVNGLVHRLEVTLDADFPAVAHGDPLSLELIGGMEGCRIVAAIV